MAKERPTHSRRGFLSGQPVRDAAQRAATRDLELDGLVTSVPEGRDTIRATTRAMATDFVVVMNPGPPRQVMTAGDALGLLEPLEQKMTVYREDADLVRVNRSAAVERTIVDEQLVEVIAEAMRIAERTESAFDPTSGPLIDLWRTARADQRIPTEEEVAATLTRVGTKHVRLDETTATIRYDTEGVELNLGGIGKGFALDRLVEFLAEEGFEDVLLHGGRSSILARGEHAGQGGWPVGIVDPLTRNRRLATLLLRDQAMSTSGSSVQYFRHDGQRYGHILDPRTGWPADGMLSVTVVAPTAAEADALSTAFFVGGVALASTYCDNQKRVGAVLVPEPTVGRTLSPVVIGLADDQLFFQEDVDVRRVE